MQVVTERFFRVFEGTNTRKAIKKYIALHDDVSTAWSAFCKKYESDMYMSSECLQGLLYENGQKPPEGWINPSNIGHSGVYRPNLRDKKCAEAAKEFKALPKKPSMFAWLDMLDIPIMVGDNRRSFKSPGFTKMRSTFYLTASEGCAVPDDVEEVSTKEAIELTKLQNED